MLFGGDRFHSHQRDPISSINHESTANSRPQIASRMQHPTVTAVQRALTKLGYYHRSVDGLYGPATRKAVARYQTDYHLSATGTLTSQMLRLLRVSPISQAEPGHYTKQFRLRKPNSES
jgi:peptidoglycan hydrolase-like protein with peptidoglycan-binding domain